MIYIVYIVFTGKPIKSWGSGLMSVLPRALQYIESQKRYAKENKDAWLVEHETQ